MPTGTTLVRSATLSDLPEIMRVVNAAYRVEAFFKVGDRIDRAGLEERFAREGSAFLVIDAAASGTLAATVYLEMRADRGWFGLLAVDPLQQGRGYARRLIEAMETICRKAELSILELNIVDLRTDLPAFYQRFGFEESGRAPFSGADLLLPAEYVIMSKTL